MASYDMIPKGAKTQPTKFTVSIPEAKLQQMKQLVSLSPIGPETYENLQESRDLDGFGISRKWLQNAKEQWEGQFDWRATESYINGFPHYTLPVTDDDGRVYTLHFVALFSSNPAAVPVAFFHGWPGSFLEFLPMLELLRQKYPTPAALPYHVLVPSLPGFAFSARPPTDRDWTVQDSARLMHKLMEALGFGETGYVAQGGDIGSHISRLLGKYDACKAVHLNFRPVPKPDGIPDSTVDEAELKGVARANAFRTGGTAYALKHGTRPSTIGLALSSSPLALLAWIGEKFWSWADTPPPMATILDAVSLYWLTDTFPTSIYAYRQGFGPRASMADSARAADTFIAKPFGFSWFPMELTPLPRAWAATAGNLVWYRQHAEGGHFAALEKPALLLADVEEFVAEVWKV